MYVFLHLSSPEGRVYVSTKGLSNALYTASLSSGPGTSLPQSRFTSGHAAHDHWSSSTLSHSFRILQIAQYELAVSWQVSGWHRCFIYDLTVLIFMIRMVCFLVSLRKWVSHDNVFSSRFRVIRKTLRDNIIVYLLLLSAVLCALWILPHLIFPFTLISRHGGVGVGELEGWQLKVGCGPFCKIQEA